MRQDLLEHTRVFCAQQFGEEQADEAMRILNLYCKYNGRVTLRCWIRILITWLRGMEAGG